MNPQALDVPKHIYKCQNIAARRKGIHKRWPNVQCAWGHKNNSSTQMILTQSFMYRLSKHWAAIITAHWMLMAGMSIRNLIWLIHKWCMNAGCNTLWVSHLVCTFRILNILGFSTLLKGWNPESLLGLPALEYSCYFSRQSII